MNHHFFFLLLSFCLLFSACSSSKKKSQEAQTQDQQANAQARQSDEQKTPQQKMPPAPGSVRVTAEIINMEETPGGFHCELKIMSVIGYGANTPPLPENTEILASLKRELLEDAAQDGSEHAVSSDKLAPGMVKNLTLKYQQVLSIPGADTTSWRILSIR